MEFPQFEKKIGDLLYLKFLFFCLIGKNDLIWIKILNWSQRKKWIARDNQVVLLVTHTASTWPKITQNSSWNCQWSRRFNSNTFNIFLISSVWKAFWNEIVQKSFVLALCIVFSCEFYSIEIKIDQYFHCILNYVMLSDFINILWCIFKFDQLDLACLFWSSEPVYITSILQESRSGFQDSVS